MTRLFALSLLLLVLAGCATLGRYTLGYEPEPQTPPPAGSTEIPLPGPGSVVVTEEAGNQILDSLANELDDLLLPIFGYGFVGRPVRRWLEALVAKGKKSE